MTFQQAVKHLAGNDGTYNTRTSDPAIQVVFDAVEPLCKTATDGNDGNETTLFDWLLEGAYHTSDTPQSIADEWDELTEQANG